MTAFAAASVLLVGMNLYRLMVVVMSHSQSYTTPEKQLPTTPVSASGCCSQSKASPQLNKLYQAFIFSLPIFFFIFILLFFFYLFYLRRRRLDWSSLTLRSSLSLQLQTSPSTCELGLKKELREMLPIIVFKQSFFVKEILCSVCLEDYKAADRLQQIPACGHTYHMECIDHWLSTHTTCPLCRLSLNYPPKGSSEKLETLAETSTISSNAENGHQSHLPQRESHAGTQDSEEFS